jgi:glycerol-3-phosphate dehydrogenase
LIHSGSEKVLKILPGLRKEGLRGGVVIWDRVTNDKALVEKTLSSAAKHGAALFEHSAVESCRHDKTEGYYTIGVRRENSLNEFKARKVVDATGAWIDETRKLFGEYDHDIVSPVAGCHIELKPFCPMSVLLQAKDDRIFFCIHVNGVARVGTTERTHHDPDNVGATQEEIDYLLNSLGFYFPAMRFGRESILSADAGIRPLVRPEKNLTENEISREHRFRSGPSGILHIVGVKLTDHRRAAEEAVGKLVRDLAKYNPSIKSRSGTADEAL